ncbi:MAG: FKBP-type peptidyl-prolyl cis-trans isomerase [bacterium]
MKQIFFLALVVGGLFVLGCPAKPADTKAPDTKSATTQEPATETPAADAGTSTATPEGTTTTDAGTAPEGQTTAAPTASPVWTADEDAAAKATPSGLKILDQVAGTGDELTAGKTAVVNYTGWLTDGTPFDSNVDPKFNHVQPFETTIPGQVIAGWNEGMLGMKVGGKRKLYIPAELGYGASGSPPKIPPSAPLVFQVELVAVK